MYIADVALLCRYCIIQAASSTLYTAIPLLVGISSLSTYITLGHELTVATALTSLALFDILRFPLFVLPQVINNIVEARVSGWFCGMIDTLAFNLSTISFNFLLTF